MNDVTISYVKLVRDDRGVIVHSENANHLIRKPLKASVIRNLYAKHSGPVEFARAIEALHSIKESP